MKFQISNTEGNPLSMGELDKEAAEFFGVSYDEKQYAKPNPRVMDWYNLIGYTIAYSPYKGRLSWDDVVGHILRTVAFATDSFDELHNCIIAYKPHIELCYHWKTKGYTPVCL